MTKLLPMAQDCAWNSVNLISSNICTKAHTMRNAGMSFLLRTHSALLLLLHLIGCGWGDPGYVRPGDYECDAGAAVVKHLIQTAPDPAPQVPKEYCILRSKGLTPVDKSFNDRFSDMKKTFISAEGSVSFKENLGYPQNPKTGIAPTVLHLAHMHRETDGSYTVEAAWAYKLAFERFKLKASQTEGHWHIQVLEKLAHSDGKAHGE
jgi:hypothetical protein